MKIGDSISNYYRSVRAVQLPACRRQPRAASSALRHRPISSGGSISSSSLSSAHWVSLADKLENGDGAVRRKTC